MMNRNINTLEMEQNHNSTSNPDGISCDNCGDRFEKPLFTTVSSGQVLKEYYACPKCLSKIITVDVQKPKKATKIENVNEEVPEIEAKEEAKTEDKILGCKNSIGYLKRRPKNSPIPEECFICNKMIDCMAY